MKRTMYAEAAYLIGLIALAMGTALMETANFGVSMVVAPAYLLYMKLSQLWPFFSFGMAEYVLQFTLMLLLIIVVRRFRWSYLVSFATAILYGVILDGCMALVALLPNASLALRMAYYVLGMVVCALGVALLFKTYIAPEVYELFVKEFAERYGFRAHHVKTVYDLCSCAVAVLLSFAFFGFGHFEGVKWGTVLCALVNGWIIGRCSAGIDRYFEVRDALPLRRYMA